MFRWIGLVMTPQFVYFVRMHDETTKTKKLQRGVWLILHTIL